MRLTLLKVETIRQGIFEILLIVVGILIALQIDNWNQERQNKAYETLILKEISNALKSDLSNNEKFFIPRIELKENAIKQLHQWIHEGYKPEANELGSVVDRMSVDFLPRYDQGPYESLKTWGLRTHF